MLRRAPTRTRRPSREDAYVARCEAYKAACRAIEARIPKWYMVPTAFEGEMARRAAPRTSRRTSQARILGVVHIDAAPYVDDLPF